MTRASRGRRRDGERGQIMVLFTLVVVLLMALAAVVIDLSLLRTDRQRLQDALDAGALAAGHSLPADSTNVASVNATAVAYTQTNYPAAPVPATKYACLVGIDAVTGLPRVGDMPAVCNVSLAATDPAWRCTDAVCWAPCDPVAHPTDVCNTIVLSDSVTQPYTFGRAVGINSGNTGVVQSAVCTGLCGQYPNGPVDAVLLLDRTGSMVDSISIGSLRAGARNVLSAFDPSIQRIALGFTGPTSETRTGGGYYGADRGNPRGYNDALPTTSCTSPNTVHAIAIDPALHPAGPVPTFVSATQNANATAGASSITIPKPSGLHVGDFLLAAITIDDGNGVNINPANGSGWTQLRRTNNGGSVGVVTYWKFATSSDTTGGNYTWNLSNGTRAAGIILRYTGVDPDTANAINASDDATNTSSTVTAPSIRTSDANTALIGVFTADTRGGSPFTSNFSMTGGNALSERGDIANGGATSGPSIAVGTGTQSSANDTGTRTATAASSTRWASQLIALHAVPGPADTYDTSDVAQWIPIGFTGTDTDTPPVTYREAYVDANGNPIASSHIVQAIGCFDISEVGTNLATPLEMAKAYLQAHGRPGVKQGIILETDGTPEHNPGQTGVGDWNNFTCSAVSAAANDVKNAGIELFTIGYGVDAASNGGTAPVCPDNHGRTVIQQLASMATNSSTTNRTRCDADENTDSDDFFCTPTGGDLQGVLKAAAVQLAGGSRLVQLYPQPIVTAVAPAGGPSSGGTTVTVSGKYFTDAYAVTFGGAPATFTILSDTSIRATAPGGGAGSTVDIQVSTPGGASKIVSVDHFHYSP
jgi:IPT/TIG domain/Putative Flp pilus-assembly TadE/G-like/von Willebrand factor type A domain